MRRIALTFCLFATTACAAELTGFISDSNCGAKNANTTAESAECARSCVKGGAEPIFVSENGQKVYRIADKSKVMDHVGEKVVVNGSVKGDVIEVASVRKTK